MSREVQLGTYTDGLIFLDLSPLLPVVCMPSPISQYSHTFICSLAGSLPERGVPNCGVGSGTNPLCFPPYPGLWSSEGERSANVPASYPCASIRVSAGKGLWSSMPFPASLLGQNT